MVSHYVIVEYCVLHPRSDSRNWPRSSECWPQVAPILDHWASLWPIREFWKCGHCRRSVPLSAEPAPKLWLWSVDKDPSAEPAPKLWLWSVDKDPKQREHIRELVEPWSCMVRSFIGTMQSFIFLLRKPRVLLALPTVFWTWVSHDRSSLMVTPKYLLESITSNVWPSSMYWVCSTFFYVLSGVNLICQVVSQCSNAESLYQIY